MVYAVRLFGRRIEPINESTRAAKKLNGDQILGVCGRVSPTEEKSRAISAAKSLCWGLDERDGRRCVCLCAPWYELFLSMSRFPARAQGPAATTKQGRWFES